MEPRVLAFVIADRVFVDPFDGKKFIIGTYSAIASHIFPAIHRSMSIYLAITNGHGQVDLRLRLIDADEERDPVFENKVPISFSDPLATVEVITNTSGNVIFPVPGHYRLQLFANKNLICERLFLVHPQ